MKKNETKLIIYNLIKKMMPCSPSRLAVAGAPQLAVDVPASRLAAAVVPDPIASANTKTLTHFPHTPTHCKEIFTYTVHERNIATNF